MSARLKVEAAQRLNQGNGSGIAKEREDNAPVDGLSPNCTIWRRLTPVAGNLA